jgi:hypothetical protein
MKACNLNLVMFLLAFFPGSLLGQDAPHGTVNFANAAANLDAPVILQTTGAGAEGPGWQAELLIQSGSNFVSAAGPVPFETNELAGYFFGGTANIPGRSAGETAVFKVRVESLTGGVAVDSAPVTVVLGGGIYPPANLEGLKQMDVPGSLLLSARGQEGQVVLSWSRSASNTLLESSATLPGDWTAVAVGTVTNLDSISVTLNASDAARFFRLAPRSK